MDNKFYINSSELNESIRKLALIVSKTLEKHKNLFTWENSRKFDKKYLDKFSLEKIEDLILSSKETDDATYRSLLNYYNRRVKLDSTKKSLKELIKILKKINLLKTISIRNKRDFIRTIFCFNFKNLDDTHSTIIFN